MGITALAHDPVGNRLVLADWDGAAVRAYDLSTGVQTDVWRPRRGTGLELPKGIAATLVADDRVLVADELRQNALISVDLATGSRTVLDGGGASIYASTINAPAALAADPAHGRALFAGLVNGNVGVAAIDLATGLRTVVSNGVPAFGPTWTGTVGIDTDGTTAWVSAKSPVAVIGVDLATGMRTTVTGPGLGQGAAFSSVWAVRRDPAGDRLFVGANVVGIESGVFTVDLASGDRTALYTDLVGSGPLPGAVVSMAVLGGGTALRAQSGPTLISVDVASQAGAELASNAFGTGVRLWQPRIVGVRADGVMIVHDDGTNAVLAVDPTNGARIVLSK